MQETEHMLMAIVAITLTHVHVGAALLVNQPVAMTIRHQLVGRAEMAVSAINKYYACDIMCKAFKSNKNKRKNFFND
jgi:hypothetical protein